MVNQNDEFEERPRASEDDTDVKEMAEREADNAPHNVVFFNPTLSNSTSNAVNKCNMVNISTPPASIYNQRKRATEYIKRGWSPVPVKFKGEEPISSDWQRLRMRLKDVDRWLSPNENTNIGIILGEPSGDLVVVDIVDKDALPFAEFYLRETMVFGRTSKRKSHWVYRIQSEYVGQMVDPRKVTVGGGVILEVRGDGQHAVFPGSIHESGEPITFEEGFNLSDTPKPVQKPELEVGIDMVHIATVLFKRWKFADRRALTLNTAKCLLAAGWAQGGVEDLLRVVAKEAGDDDIDSYLLAIQTALNATYRAGRSELVDCMGEESVAAIEAPLRNLGELREAFCLDLLKFDFPPSQGISGCFPLFYDSVITQTCDVEPEPCSRD
jgi:bifunctional DNA primase/polymerase-like protein